MILAWVSHEVAVRRAAGAASSEGSIGAGKDTSEVVVPTCWLVLVVGGKPVSCYVDSFIELDSPESEPWKARQKPQCLLQSNLGVISAISPWFLGQSH